MIIGSWLSFLMSFISDKHSKPFLRGILRSRKCIEGSSFASLVSSFISCSPSCTVVSWVESVNPSNASLKKLQSSVSSSARRILSGSIGVGFVIIIKIPVKAITKRSLNRNVFFLFKKKKTCLFCDCQ